MIWYVIGINILAFFIYGLDKYLAKNKQYRVSEYSLLVLSCFGGAFGGILGMRVFHHKTKKALFWIVNIISGVIWVIILM